MKPQFRIGSLLLLSAAALAMAAPAAQQTAQPPTKDDEESAVGCLRTINTAEVSYAATYAKGFSPTLAALAEGAEGAAPTAQAAALIDRSLGSGKRNGYVLAYKAGAPDSSGQIKTYTVTARPRKWQKGMKSFFTDESGVIRWTGGKRAPTVKDPAIDSLFRGSEG